jgi:predicted peroxiredoxin
MPGKAVISLTIGLEDAEKVTVAFLVAVGAAESGRPTLMFLTKEAVRLAIDGYAVGVACDGCPPLPDLLKRYEAAGGRYYVCPVCFNAKQLDESTLIAGAPRSRAPSRCGSGSATTAPPPSATEDASPREERPCHGGPRRRLITDAGAPGGTGA